MEGALEEALEEATILAIGGDVAKANAALEGAEVEDE